MKPRKVGQIPAKADVKEQEGFKEEQLEPRLAEAQAGQRLVFFIEAVREVLGAIDLDPASCEAANRTHESVRPDLRHTTCARAALSLFQ
jgi:hypothetical protein